jgi:hypothetical protein
MIKMNFLLSSFILLSATLSLTAKSFHDSYSYSNLLLNSPIEAGESHVQYFDSLLGKNNVAQLFAEKLQQKIILTDVQTSKVKLILSEYLNKSHDPEGGLETIQGKIEPLLDSKQKAKFEIIKNDWWNSIIKAVKRSSAKQ